MTQAIAYRCPKCGDTEHLYARADARWHPVEQAWVHVDGSEEDHAIDCTECDWTGSMAECEEEQAQ